MLMSLKFFFMVGKYVIEVGFEGKEFCFYGLCLLILEVDQLLVVCKWKNVEVYIEMLYVVIMEYNLKIVLIFGELVICVMVGKVMVIIKVRGVVVVGKIGYLIFLMLLFGFVVWILDYFEMFVVDFGMLYWLKVVGFNSEVLKFKDNDYQWIWNVEEILDLKLKVIFFDMEMIGFVWWKFEIWLICVQLMWEVGMLCLILYYDQYFDKVFFEFVDNLKYLESVWCGLKCILEELLICKIVYNMKFDYQMVVCEGIEMCGWMYDMQLMLWFVDENMMLRMFDDCVWIFVFEMLGYVDEFNKCVDKSCMLEVDLKDMFDYGGGDSDVMFCLGQKLLE